MTKPKAKETAPAAKKGPAVRTKKTPLQKRQDLDVSRKTTKSGTGGGPATTSHGTRGAAKAPISSGNKKAGSQKKPVSKKPPQKKHRQTPKKKPAKTGRKLKYRPDWPLLAQGYARDGFTDAQIAEKLGMARSTFYLYLKQFSDFSDALKEGKKPVDIEIENLLLKRARGFEYEETHAEYVPGDETDDDPQPAARIVKIKKIKKLVIPDITAQIFWLKNRMPEKYRDSKAIDITPPLTAIFPPDFLPDLPDLPGRSPNEAKTKEKDK